MSAQLVAGMADYSYLNGANPAQGRAPEGPEVSTAALEYGARGMPVFPCDPASKRPLVAGGFKKATTDGSIIATWWKQWPKAMIGIPTGEPSAVFVLDIDRDAAKGIDGFAALATMEAAHEPLPETRAQRTPRGGEHRLFSWPGFKIKNSASKLGAGLDIRGDGGYIIAAPSVNADGVPYEWICEGEPVEAPRWLLVLLNGSATPAGAERRPADKTQGSRTAYAAAALADESEKVTRAANGQRNETLNCAAFNLGQLVGANAIDRSQVEGALLAAAMASGLVADDGEEAVRRTLKSGLDAGIAQPRDVPAFRPRITRSHGTATGEESDLGAFDRTEDGIALAFAQAHQGDLRFCHHAGKWYVWTGARWQKEETRLAFHWARRLCRAVNSTSDPTLAKASTAAAVERFAQADRAFAVTSAIWDADPFLLGTPAGVVDLRIGKLRPSKRGDYITKQAAVAPDRDAGIRSGPVSSTKPRSATADFSVSCSRSRDTA